MKGNNQSSVCCEDKEFPFRDVVDEKSSERHQLRHIVSHSGVDFFKYRKRVASPGDSEPSISEERASVDTEVRRYRKKTKKIVEKRARKLSREPHVVLKPKAFADMTREERLQEIYKDDGVMIGSDNNHIYADIIKEVFMKEVEKAGDAEMAMKLKTVRDIATKKSSLIMICLNQWQELVKLRARELQEERERRAARNAEDLAAHRRKA